MRWDPQDLEAEDTEDYRWRRDVAIRTRCCVS